METGNSLVDAQSAFARERRRRRRDKATSFLLRRPAECSRLVPLESALGSAPSVPRGRPGLFSVPLESIVGTAEVAKQRAFDKNFRPPDTSRERWQRIWIAGRRGQSLPPVSLFRVGDRHFVSDGPHRVSVALSLGRAAIDAEVTALD